MIGSPGFALPASTGDVCWNQIPTSLLPLSNIAKKFQVEDTSAPE